MDLRGCSSSFAHDVLSPRNTMNVVHPLDLEYVFPNQPAVKIELRPARYGSKLWPRNVSQRAKTETIY